jgi:hypothetical protein
MRKKVRYAFISNAYKTPSDGLKEEMGSVSSYSILQPPKNGMVDTWNLAVQV